MRIHTFETGRLVGNETFLRGDGFGALLRRPRPYEFPCLNFVIEQPDGLLAIDTGMTAHVRPQRGTSRMVPRPFASEEIGPQMRARGLDPTDVRRVVITHLDWDHVGGVRHFPRAEVLVHRPEFEFSRRLPGRMRYQPKTWPADFSPTLYDLEPEPAGSFERSLRLGDDIALVPLGGHSIGQVGVLVSDNRTRLLFAADHVLRQDWFEQDLEEGRMLGMGQFFPDLARESTERIAELMRERPTVLVPSHDSEAPARLQSLDQTDVTQRPAPNRLASRSWRGT